MSQDLEAMLKEGPTLTLEPFLEDEPKEELIKSAEEKLSETDRMRAILSPKEQQQVDAFVKQIDLANSQMVLQYGASSQKKIADFSETALSKVRTKDLGEIGNDLASVVTELKSIDEEEEDKSLFGLFKKNVNRLANMKVKYAKAEVNVNRICKVLEGHQIQLLKDAAMLDQMYELNQNYYKELSMYILAGKQKLEEVRTEELPKLLQKAQESGLAEDTQKAQDLAELCNRFEKKIYDLELTRTVSMQMAPQIRMIQNNDTVMTQKL